MIKKVKADLHNHLRTISPQRGFDLTLDKIRQKLGKGGVLGLANYQDRRYEQLTEKRGRERLDLGNAIYDPKTEILIVKAQEIPTKQGDLLVLGLQKKIHMRSRRNLEESIKEAKEEYNAIPIICYASLAKYLENNPEVCRQADAIEVYNGEANLWIPGKNPKDANANAEIFYEKVRRQFPSLGSVITSDGHSLYEIGTSYMKIPFPNIQSSDNLIETLRQGIQMPRNREEEERGVFFSFIGAIDHIGALVFYIALEKIGIDLNGNSVPSHIKNL